MSKSEEDFQASLKILETAVTHYHRGLKDAYRVVAGELRKLLCDANPLLPRVRPKIRLHKLIWTEKLEGCPSLVNGLEVIIPGSMSQRPDGSCRFELLFAMNPVLMEVDQWIEQPFLSPSITVRELIRSVADKEGVHSDPDYNDTLIAAKLVKYIRDDSHIPSIIALGEYLLKWLRDCGGNTPNKES
ncbi:MAG: hypothetical protein HY695_30785 [Deltaproteobacteria bacterium]|nr:hypothetical protein [Deltaproteobacteria bacterium]